MAAIVWKGFISFGLVSFPVRLFSAGRAEAVHFHMLHKKDLSRVKEVWYCAEEDKPIERKDMVKGYETGKGEYVVVEEEELKAVAPATASTMEIVQFVKADDVDPIYYESSYYVSPGDEISKPYVLFVKALEQTEFSAIAKLTMHGREHTVLIRVADDQLILHTMFYQDELHEGNKPKVPAKANSTAQELKLATELIKHLAGPFKPAQFHDTYRESVQKMIAQKQKGKTFTPAAEPKRAPVVDLMEALKKSIAELQGKRKTAKTAKTKKRAA